MRTPLLILSLLVITPGWDGPRRLGLLAGAPRITATRVQLDSSDPARRTVGRLTYLGGVKLTNPDPTFGGFSALRVQGTRFTLLSDGGNIVTFRMGRDWQPRDAAFAELPDGPGSGWEKADRDSESLTVDPASGDVLVGFERANMIWRYDAALRVVRRHVAPPAMANWTINGGSEAMLRLPDGGVIVIAEDTVPEGGGRAALRFAGDPTLAPGRGFHFVYQPPDGFDPSDAALLPDGRILVLNRSFAWPLTFSAKLTIVDPRDIRPHARVAGEEIATLAAPSTVDNFEGVAVTRERGATILWLVTDDNQFLPERTLLMKFRLDPLPDRAKRPAASD